MTSLAILGAYSAVAGLVCHRCAASRLPLWKSALITALWPIPALSLLVWREKP